VTVRALTASERRASSAPRDRGRFGLLLLGAMVGAMLAGRFETALACVAASTLAAKAAQARAPSRAWIASLGFGAAVALLLNLYLTTGHPLGGPVLFGRPPSAEGLRFGMLLVLRMVGAMVALHGLRAAWPGERAADELLSLLRPLERLRVPVHEARMMMGLALRFAPLVADEGRRIARLQEHRAGRPPRGAREWLERRRAVVVPTLVSSFERAERVALALEARHYRARPAAAQRRRWTGWGIAGLLLAGTSLLWR